MRHLSRRGKLLRRGDGSPKGGGIVSEPGVSWGDRGGELPVAPWTALLLAGSRPGVDPLAAHFGVTAKALIPVAGEPMVARVARTLLATPEVGRVRVVGPAALDAVLPTDTRLERRDAAGSIAGVLRDVLREPALPLPLLVTTADHALLSTGMVRAFLAGAGGADVGVGGVERRTVLGRFPGTRRTWLRFRGGAYTGANLFAIGHERALAAVELWAAVEQDRKSARRLVGVLGPRLLLGAALRLVTAEDAVRQAGRRLGLEARVVVLEDALAAVDVDRVADHRLVEEVLSGSSPEREGGARVSA